MLTSPKCGRQVRQQPLCLYCGARLLATPVAILGMNGPQWLAEGARVLLVTDAPVGDALARELASVNARLQLPFGQPAIEVVPP